MAQLNFDATQVEPSRPIEPLPDGKYPMVFVDSEIKTTKTGTGSYLQLTAEVIEGEYKGQKVWERLNLDNPNQQAVEIAQRTLSAICHALNVMRPQDSVELHDKPFTATVRYVPPKGEYKATNEITGYEPYGAPNNATPHQQAAQTAQAQAPTGSVIGAGGAKPAQQFWK